MSTSRSAFPDAYAGSDALAKIEAGMRQGRTPHIACLDIDSTLTGSPSLADAVRARLEHAGYVVMFNTSRSEEMVMSSQAYAASVRNGEFCRPAPHLGLKEGRRQYVPPEDHEPWGVLDGDIIAGSTGTRLLLRQKDGAYLPDRAYGQRAEETSQRWRARALHLIESSQRQVPGTEIAAIDRPDNYDAGRTDISPPDFRVQVNFTTLEDKRAFVACLRQMQRATGWFNVRAIDDSNPESSGYKVFLMPRRLSKLRALERVVEATWRKPGVPRAEVSLLAAGDSYPDLAMGLLGGLGARATLLLVGGSRLTEALVGGGPPDFAGESVWAIRRRLRLVRSPGRYEFRAIWRGAPSRQLIVGDQAFSGTNAVETVAAYLDSLDL